METHKRKELKMGTRGAVGFYKKINGRAIHKVAYNHFDSYPSGLGDGVLKMISERSIDDLNEMFDKITMVNENKKPNAKQVKRCKELGLVNLGVSSQSVDDWYCILRNAQGSLESYADVGFMGDGFSFMGDSLFCEWAYIINLTDNTLEVYEGFQRSKPKGRYSRRGKNSDGYYWVGLVASYPLDEIPQEFTDSEIDSWDREKEEEYA
jgi:hypothetical protein